MLWFDAALVTVTIGTALVIVSPLARLLGLYAPTELVKSGYVLGMYGRPTWRFWAFFTLFFVVHSAWHFEKGNVISGAAWAMMSPVFLVFLLQAARAPKAGENEAEPATEGDAT